MDTVSFLSDLLGSIFPSYCLYCGELVESKSHCCPVCAEQLVLTEENTALYAVSRIRDAKALFSVYRYDKCSRQAVFRLKFRRDRGAAFPIADEMANKIDKAFLEQSILPKHALDRIIPVPMHPKAERKRGYNQSALLAKRIARRLNVPYTDKILYKVKNTKKQHTVSFAERDTNLEHAFRVKNPETVAGKRILLVDDVCTSGNTFSHCVETLKNAGAAEIYCACFLLRKGRWQGYCHIDPHYPTRYHR